MTAEELNHTLYRLSLADALQTIKRWPVFRSASFAVGELEDPFDPSEPFNMAGLLPEIEEEWNFSRESVPEWITLKTGKAARSYYLVQLEAEYARTPAERFQRIKRSTGDFFQHPLDPDSWEHASFLCLIRIPPECTETGHEVNWFGHRSRALTDRALRHWLFDPRAKVLHGKEAAELARGIWEKLRGVDAP